MVDTRSNMQLRYINLKPHGVKSLMDLIEWAIGVQFYSPQGSEHYKLLCLDKFYDSTHGQTFSHDKQAKKRYEYWLSLIMSIMRFIKITRANFRWKSNNYIHTTQLHKKRPLVIPSLSCGSMWFNECVSPASSFDFYVKGQTYYKKTLLMIILYVYILVRPYTQIFFWTHSYTENHQTPSIHIFTP